MHLPQTWSGKLMLSVVVLAAGGFAVFGSFLLVFGRLSAPHYDRCVAVALPTTTGALTQAFGKPTTSWTAASGETTYEFEPSAGYVYIYSAGIQATARQGSTEVHALTCAQ